MTKLPKCSKPKHYHCNYYWRKQCTAEKAIECSGKFQEKKEAKTK